MSETKQEQVLCFKRSLFTELGEFNGLSFDVSKYLPAITAPGNVLYRDRTTVETDETVLQLIPYVLVVCTPNDGASCILRYRRGKKGGEQRLHGLYSVGLGGHIAIEDKGATTDLIGYQTGMEREMMEELGVVLSTENTPPAVALLYDATTPVGRVHFGVVHVLRTEDLNLTNHCEDLVDPDWLTLDQKHDLVAYEGWSQLCLGLRGDILLRAGLIMSARDEIHGQRN